MGLFLIACNEDKEEENAPNNSNNFDLSERGLIERQIAFNGNNREFLIYIPNNYSNSKNYPLIFNLHGNGGTREGQQANARFDLIADTADLIIITPQAIGQWNANDLEFFEFLIDELSRDYSVAEERVYACGFSLGGYFSFEIACQLSNRFAAIASIAGAMTVDQVNRCAPTQAIPILQIHGTQDPIVGYSTAEDIVDLWVGLNQCDSNTVENDLADLSPNDGSTVKSFLFENDSTETAVLHYRVIGGGHDWPGSSGNMDITASVEIWKFFSKYDLNGKTNP